MRVPRAAPLALALAACVLVSVTADQGTYKPEGNVTAAVWTGANLPTFVYPELSSSEYGIPSLQAKPDFGIAVSGGGYRATTLALGWVRALYWLGAVAKSRYLSSNSGGSWFNGAFSYTQVRCRGRWRRQASGNADGVTAGGKSRPGCAPQVG